MLQVLLQSLKRAIHFKIMSILSRAQFKVYAFKQRVWINHGPKTDPFASLLEEFEAYPYLKSLKLTRQGSGMRHC